MCAAAMAVCDEPTKKEKIYCFTTALAKHLGLAHHCKGREEFSNAMRERDNDLDRVNYFLEKFEGSDILERALESDAKIDDEAKIFQEQINAYYEPAHYEAYLDTASKMVMTAKSSEMLGRAYAERSAVLFKLEKYEECVEDIDRALAQEYPVYLRNYILERREKAIQLKDSQIRFKVCEPVPTIPDNKKNPSNENTTDSIEILEGANRSYVVATKDIEMGDVIALDTPIATSVTRTGFTLHCHFCFTLCYNPIHCQGCTQTLYCSETCKQMALDSYHRDECPVYLSLNNLLIKEFGRMFLMRPLFEKNTDKKAQILHLAKKADFTAFRTGPIMFKFPLVGAVIYGLIRDHTNLLEDPEDQIEFKSTIVPYLMYNLLFVSLVGETICPGKIRNIECFVKTQPYALGVYPLKNKFRHSCCPNVHVFNYGLTKVIRAVKTIKEGEECFLSYGPSYESMKLQERQDKMLSHYGFKCECKACVNNWPTYIPPSSRWAQFYQPERLCAANILNNDTKRLESAISDACEKLRVVEPEEPSNLYNACMRYLICNCNALGSKAIL